MFRFPYAIQHYIEKKGWTFAAIKAKEFALGKVSDIELEWFLNYARRLPHHWQEKRF